MKYQSANIMIVEDERIIAMDVQNLLIQSGHQNSSVYSSGEAAIAAVQEIRPDLVLMDINLKGSLDGLETIRRIREQQDIRVIYITALMDDETKARAEAVCPYRIINKPIHEHQLFEVIEKTFNSYPL